MHHYAFHVGDYASSTAHLTNEEDLCYRRMLDLYYQTEQGFTDVAFVARRVRMPLETVQIILREFFIMDGETYRHERCDKEIGGYRAKAESARNATRSRIAKPSKTISSTESLTESLTESSRDHERDRQRNRHATSNQEPVTNNHISHSLPRASAHPRGWPDSEEQARAMAVTAGVDPDFAANHWLLAEGKGEFPSGGFAMWIKGKWGFEQQKRREQTRADPRRGTNRTDTLNTAGRYASKPGATDPPANLRI